MLYRPTRGPALRANEMLTSSCGTEFTDGDRNPRAKPGSRPWQSPEAALIGCTLAWMTWHPDPNDKSGWISVGGVLALTGGGGLAAWHTAITPDCAFGLLGGIGLYISLMPLLRLPPWPRASAQDRAPGEPEAPGASPAPRPVEERFASVLPRKNALLEAMERSEASRDLKHQLREGLRLTGRLDAQEDRKMPHTEDPVYRWARATWVALDHQRPIVAKEFFGDKSPYSRPFFATAYGIEVARVGQRAYLADRIAILSRVVEPSFGEPSRVLVGACVAAPAEVLAPSPLLRARAISRRGADADQTAIARHLFTRGEALLRMATEIELRLPDLSAQDRERLYFNLAEEVRAWVETNGGDGHVQCFSANPAGDFPRLKRTIQQELERRRESGAEG
jgi:hypothetical protein